LIVVLAFAIIVIAFALVNLLVRVYIINVLEGMILGGLSIFGLLQLLSLQQSDFKLFPQIIDTNTLFHLFDKPLFILALLYPAQIPKEKNPFSQYFHRCGKNCGKL
jgi:hypothetical protein